MHAVEKMAKKMKARDQAFVIANHALNSVPQRNFPAVWIEITWHYKYGVKPDFDNVVASAKPLIDGCAQAFGINDRDLELGRVRRVRTLDEKLAKTVILHFDTEAHD